MTNTHETNRPKSNDAPTPADRGLRLCCVYCGKDHTNAANGPNGEDVACCGEVGHMEWIHLS